MTKRPSQILDKFIVRLPVGMRDQISGAAKANNRTMTAEIVARLRWSFEAGSDFGSSNAGVDASRTPIIEERLAAVEAQLSELTLISG